MKHYESAPQPEIQNPACTRCVVVFVRIPILVGLIPIPIGVSLIFSGEIPTRFVSL